jgi:hypothetical protein
MKLTAVEEAGIRLERARATIPTMERTDIPIKDVESAWWSFLLSANSVYTKLEQGSKDNGKSKAWFGRAKHVRKNDPLLSYLHHARNSDEHSLEATAVTGIADLKSLHPEVKVSEPGQNVRVDFDPNANLEPGTPLATLKVGLCVLPVTDDRYGDTFPVPTSHMGEGLSRCRVRSSRLQMNAVSGCNAYGGARCLEGLGTEPTLRCRREEMATDVESIVDRGMCRKESLSRSG